MLAIYFPFAEGRLVAAAAFGYGSTKLLYTANPLRTVPPLHMPDQEDIAN